MMKDSVMHTVGLPRASAVQGAGKPLLTLQGDMAGRGMDSGRFREDALH